MSKLNISNLRFWIAQSIKKIFDIIDWKELTNSVFLVHNIADYKYPEKLSFLTTHFTNGKKTMLKKEKWMNLNNLKKIWEDIHNKEKYFLQQGYFYKTKSNKDTWIEWVNSKINNLSDDKRIIDLIKYYKEMKNIDTAQELIGGSRKILDAQIKTAENYFNKSFLLKIKGYFNGYNFAHDNRNGEEIYDKNKGKITKRSINPKLKNFSNNELFKLCDYLVEFLDIFVAMLKLGNFKK